MQNENAQHDHYNDEIDLADLVRSLWDGKWLVIGVTFLTTLLAVAYLMLVPKTYTGSLEIAALPTAQADAYTELNATKFIEIDKEKLLSLFVEDLKLYYSIDKFIFKNQYITQDSDETDSEFSFRLRQTAYNFSFTPPSATNAKNKKANWQVNIITHDQELARKILQQSLLTTTNNVNAQIEQTILRSKAQHSRKLNNELHSIENERSNAIARYRAQTQARVAYLSEQAQIARLLNIDDGTLSSQNYTAGASVVTAVTADKALYLRGYLAIEKEIQLLKSRASEEPFIPMIVTLDSRKRLLQQDAVIEQMQQVLSNTPIGTSEFAAATYDLASIQYTSKTKSTLVLALSIVLGGMLGIFVLLIRNAVIRKD